MTQTLLTKDITLCDLITHFGLQLSEDEQFFRAGKDELPEITNAEKQFLDRFKLNYLHYFETNWSALWDEGEIYQVLQIMKRLVQF